MGCIKPERNRFSICGCFASSLISGSQFAGGEKTKDSKVLLIPCFSAWAEKKVR